MLEYTSNKSARRHSWNEKVLLLAEDFKSNSHVLNPGYVDAGKSQSRSVNHNRFTAVASAVVPFVLKFDCEQTITITRKTLGLIIDFSIIV